MVTDRSKKGRTLSSVVSPWLKVPGSNGQLQSHSFKDALVNLMSHKTKQTSEREICEGSWDDVDRAYTGWGESCHYSICRSKQRATVLVPPNNQTPSPHKRKPQTITRAN